MGALGLTAALLVHIFLGCGEGRPCALWVPGGADVEVSLIWAWGRALRQAQSGLGSSAWCGNTAAWPVVEERTTHSR